MTATRINPNAGTVAVREYTKVTSLPASGTVTVDYSGIGISGYSIAGIVAARCKNHGLSAFMSFSQVQSSSAVLTVFKNIGSTALNNCEFVISVLYVKD